VRVLVTGSQGFIGSYLVPELLRRGHEVVGVDSYSKYGPVVRACDPDPLYEFTEGDARDPRLLTDLVSGCDHFIALAAMVGGISYFHTWPYDLLFHNDLVTATAFEVAIRAHQQGSLRKLTLVSSSMVYESATSWPTAEGDELLMPPPRSAYGMQKLAAETYARAAWDQYGLPYTILRPFNCAGTGEARALGAPEVLSGNVKLAMSHVVPDLVHKVLAGQDPLRILGDGSQVRHYTYGGDLAAGIVTAMEHPAAVNEDFNLSTAASTTVTELASLIWRKIHGPDKPLHLVPDPPYEHDVAKRIPSTAKAREVLGWEATTTLDQMLDVVIPWVRDAITAGTI
jgi:nucleoside-diphosphate-sugar epimerase